MKVGDLVTLSSAGRKLHMNSDIVEDASYGMVVGRESHNSKIINVRWFKKDGTLLYDWRDPRNLYRWELKKFKKKMNKT